MTPKFNLGDKVTSKKTGNIIIGHVSGIITPKAWGLMCNPSVLRNTMNRYSSLFSDWLDKPMYIVYTPYAQKPCSYIEYLSQTEAPDNIASQFFYMNQVPNLHTFFYPEDDLELIEAAQTLPALAVPDSSAQ